MPLCFAALSYSPAPPSSRRPLPVNGRNEPAASWRASNGPAPGRRVANGRAARELAAPWRATAAVPTRSENPNATKPQLRRFEINKIRHLNPRNPNEFVSRPQMDECSQSASFDAVDQAMRLVFRDRPRRCCPSHVSWSRENTWTETLKNEGRVRGGQERVRHGAHRAALHAAVIVRGRRARIVRHVLGASGDARAGRGRRHPGDGHGVRVGRECGRGSPRQLQTRALPPGGRAGDKRKRDSQSQHMAKNATHRPMLTGAHDGRQRFFRGARQQSFDEDEAHRAFPATISATFGRDSSARHP